MEKLSLNKAYIGVILISLALFYPFLGMVHLFDWDEINFAEAAREMIATGDYSVVQINYLPFWEKISKQRMCRAKNRLTRHDVVTRTQ